MMRRSPLDRLRKLQSRVLVPLTALAVALLLIAFNVPVPQSLSGGTKEAVAPVLSWSHSLQAAVYALYASVESKESLVRENAQLHEEISRLRSASFMADVYETENEKLRIELFERSDSRDHRVATVLSSVTAPYDTLLIDAGSDDGVVERALVFYGENTALGFIASVSPHTSVVHLFSKPDLEVEVLVGKATSTRLVAVGQGAGALLVRVPRNVDIAVGDPVLLPHERPYLLASVRALQGDPSDPFVTAWFSSPVPAHSLRRVSVSLNETWTVPTTFTERQL